MKTQHDMVYELSTFNSNLEKLKSYIESVNYNCTGKGNVLKKCITLAEEDIAIYLMKLRPWKTQEAVRVFFERFVEIGYLNAIDYVIEELKYDIHGKKNSDFNIFKHYVKTRYQFITKFIPHGSKNIMKSFVHLHKRGYITSVDLVLGFDGSDFMNDLLMGVDVET